MGNRHQRVSDKVGRQRRVTAKDRLQLRHAAGRVVTDRLVREAQHDVAQTGEVVLPDPVVDEGGLAAVEREPVELHCDAHLRPNKEEVQPVRAVIHGHRMLSDDVRSDALRDRGGHYPAHEGILKERTAGDHVHETAAAHTRSPSSAATLASRGARR